MANSASDESGSEREMRRKLIETGAVDVIVSTSPNMFFTVTPVTLWFLDRGKRKGSRADEVLSSTRDKSSARSTALSAISRRTRLSSLAISCGCGAVKRKNWKRAAARRCIRSLGTGDTGMLGLCKVATGARRDRRAGLEPEPRSLCRRRAWRSGGR
ncbi:N-6 DNA methylase [Rhizobium sp. F40D2]|uniref:N-6 DNA methylase n=1 Tax=Rhizobium sp. F40D2 TaxID=3453141 RepID=UPI003F1F91A4